MHEILSDSLNALYTLLIQLGVYAGLPGLYLCIRNGGRNGGLNRGPNPRQFPAFATVCLSTALLMAFQAIFSTILAFLLPAFSSAQHLALLLPGTVLAGECARRLAPERAPPDPWLPWILLLAVTVRMLPAVQAAALGQSDAYSHLQFLRDAVNTGHLRHGFYPPGHARVTAVAAWAGGLSPHVLARHGGAFYGLGLVAGIYVLTAKASAPVAARTAARTAGLLAAAFPGIVPLLRTGVGLFANQLGLLWIPFLLFMTLGDRETRKVRLISGTVLGLGLLLTVPMMLLDLAPVLLLWACLRLSPRVSVPLALSVLVAGVIASLLLLAQFAPESREAMVRMLTLGDLESPGIRETFVHLLSDYLLPGRTAHPVWVRIPVLGLALLALAATWPCKNRPPAWMPLLILCGISGIQSATAILQFTTYQRAGWFFLLSACALGGVCHAGIRNRFPRPRLWDAALVCVCLISLIHPPQHRPHLSGNEEQLVRTLLELRSRHAVCTHDVCVTHEAPVHLHARAFTRFDGAQGDPVPAYLEDIPCFRFHRYLPGDLVPPPPAGLNIFLLDPDPPPPTGDEIFDREVTLLVEINKKMRATLNTLREDEATWLDADLSTGPHGFEIHTGMVPESHSDQ
ncbi:MAG: hypothetical protein JJU29_07770 [Verrucomicrobia bacterium]|nr:hypothetical protein [Verrucomicrobiota bacterium]MCH8513409.1 hypothetical protein [Kiritimatiellia bacterium]